MLAPSPTDIARFWMKVEEQERGYFTPCWVWTAGNNGKYGQFYLRSGPRVAAGTGRVYAHRFAWFLAHGELPPRLFVLHRCDQTLCVRFDHLFTGTDADNKADMSYKGRSANIKLTRDERLTVAERRLIGREATASLAAEFGISPALVHHVVKTHRHRIPGAPPAIPRIGLRERAEILQRIKAGEMHRIVAADYGVTRSAVTAILARYG